MFDHEDRNKRMQWNSFDKDLRLRIFWKKGHFYDPTDNNRKE